MALGDGTTEDALDLQLQVSKMSNEEIEAKIYELKHNGKKMLPKPTEVELAYAAGIVDGEGYVGIKCSEREKEQKSRSHRVYLSVGNTDERMVKFLNDKFGGTYYYAERGSSSPNAKPMYTWKLSAISAVTFLKQVLPYLITKKERAEIAIKFQDTISNANKAKGITEELLEIRDAYMGEMFRLNKKGVA